MLIDEDDFSEVDAGAVSLDVDGRKTNSLVSELGLHVSREFRPELGTFAPYLSAAWKYDYAVDDRTIVSGFSGVPGSAFPVDGRNIDKSAALVGAGTLFQRDRWSASLEYLGEYRGDYIAHGVFGRVGFAF